MALAARFADDQETCHQTNSFFSAAKRLLKMQIDHVSLDNIHACVLMGNLCGTESESAGEAVFFGLAFRMAHILHLPEPDVTDDSITREIKIRTWWSLYMIDQWSSAGLDLPRQMHNQQHSLPMPEVDFWNLVPGQRIEDGSQPRRGLWGYMVILARIFGHIQILHQKLAEGALDQQKAEMTTIELAHEFDHFLQELPANLHFNTRNLTQHTELGLAQAFVALHLGYHHYSTLLYFPYLDMKLAEIPSQGTFVARCKHHATSFSDLLKTSHETPGCEAVYLIVAHMTVVSSSVLLHTLLFGSQHELLDARARLYFNFEILLKLKGYWQGVDLMMERLFTFQKACMQSMDRTYTVDQWTVKFLLQHAIPIDREINTPATSDLAERGKFASDALSMLRPSA
ncbi:hypothetical protein N7533_006844 [Penicillium manginii]|uniref:uncharacterized protein n=1 Tax=Penicillium manginii TaxID=203109 RepID=UPI0025472376|nr:uncharacterized protein N7533_006844 [Penicillium manginii]KAJ5749816.1 hypothetical protein N7533_006844 [Penicillium manginii]